MPRPTHAIMSAIVLAALLALAPATAHAGGEVLIESDGVVRAGYYPDSSVPFFGIDADIESFGVAAGKKATFVGSFHRIDENNPGDPFSNTGHLLESAWSAGATPFANVAVPGKFGNDAKIAEWAGRVKDWLNQGGGRSLIVAPMQEMNWLVPGGVVPWQCDPAFYRSEYRKFVSTFASFGIDETKVRWAYAPNNATAPGCGSIADYYPGHDVVDILGVSAYNQEGVGGGYDSPYTAMDAALAELTALAPAKPQMIAQTASCAGIGQDDWVSQLFDYTAAADNVVAFIWFNHNKECDWRFWNGSSITSGARSGMLRATTRYEAAPLSDWFKAGTTLAVAGPPPAPDPCPDGKDCDTVALVDGGAKFYLRDGLTTGAEQDSFFYGNPGDYPLMGDWNCDGTATPGQYRQSDGYVYLRNSNTQGVADIRFFFGNPGDLPLVGDFDGNGCDSVSLYRPADQSFHVINRLGSNEGGLGAADTAYVFGNPGDKPFVGDFDGDGIDTFGLHRESTGFVYFRNSHGSGIADKEFFFGDPGDIISAADWNGDGVDTVAVYRPGDGKIYVRLSNTAGNADVALGVGTGFIGFLRSAR